MGYDFQCKRDCVLDNDHTGPCWTREDQDLWDQYGTSGGEEITLVRCTWCQNPFRDWRHYQVHFRETHWEERKRDILRDIERSER